MKHSWLAILLLLSTVSFAQTGAPVRVVATVREVTLFARNGAEMRHEAAPNLPAGETTVRLTGLATALDAATLQVEVGHNAELISTEAVPADRPTALDSAGRLRAAFARASAEATALQEEKAMLVANRELKNVSAATWNTDVGRVAAAYRERMRDVSLRINAANQEQTRLERLVNQLNNQPYILPGTANDVLLRVRVRAAGAVALIVRYRATAAGTGWQPALALRASSLTTPLRAVSTATVTNTTGVGWNKVRLTLVNTSGSESVERPNLQPWTLRALLDADGNRRLSRNDDDDESVGEGRLDDFATKGNSTGTAGLATGTDSLHVVSPLSDRFRVAGRVSAPAGESTSVAIETLDLPMRAEYYVVPKLDPKVLLVAKVIGWQALRAPATSAAVYLAGNYVGSTDLNTRAFNDTLEVALGADPQVVVSRTKRADRNSHSLLGSTQKTTLGYEINLRNDRPAPIRVRVADQIPVPLDRDITVTATEISGATLEPESGRLTWVVNLKPGESRRLPFAFTVEAPASKTLNLEYRERVMKSPRFR